MMSSTIVWERPVRIECKEHSEWDGKCYILCILLKYNINLILSIRRDI